MPYSNKEKQREYNKKWQEDNKEKKREYNKKWKAENKKKISEYGREYYELNKEERLEYYHLNKEKIADYKRKYNERNREKRLEKQRGYRDERRAYCREYLGGKCVKCGTTHNLQFDHIKRETKKYTIAPKITNNFDNLKEELDKCQLLCAPCHLDKTAKEWEDMYN